MAINIIKEGRRLAKFTITCSDCGCEFEYEQEDVKVNSNKFKFINNGFISDIDVSKDTLVLYTVPYDKGWKAFVNKKEVKIEKVDNGLMAVKINKGINNIKFIYYPPGLKLGLILSIVSYISLLVYIIFN